MQALTLLVKTELHWLEMRALMGRVTEGLVLRETTRTVEIVLCSEDWLVNNVGTDFRRNWESCLILTEATLELIVFKLFNGDTSSCKERGMQMILKVRVLFLECLSDSLIFSEKIVRSTTIKLSNVLLNVFIFSTLLDCLDCFLVVLCGLSNWGLLLLFDGLCLLFLILWLLLIENSSKD